MPLESQPNNEQSVMKKWFVQTNSLQNIQWNFGLKLFCRGWFLILRFALTKVSPANLSGQECPQLNGRISQTQMTSQAQEPKKGPKTIFTPSYNANHDLSRSIFAHFGQRRKCTIWNRQPFQIYTKVYTDLDRILIMHCLLVLQYFIKTVRVCNMTIEQKTILTHLIWSWEI